ncbi:S1/P1 nuclease [Arenimonas sp. GDDSR-1]|uniref:S1/P1 nuclease n=1 Tax=Arenimonas sp. GDDSR-1 TaxID=2950125 RepID=UPI002622D2A2|nr:S1/P1 nuclease [Arenimonas sp. GDDSR-1]
MMRPFRVLWCLSLLLSAQQVSAWGQTGHRAIGEIAEAHMRPETVKKARALLDGHDLAYASTWADEIRSDPKRYGHTFNWHYTTWQDEDERFHSADETKDTGFLLTQVDKQLAILKNTRAPKTERAEALRFVVHLVGDAHQPLHVGGGNDRGGNTCRVTWFGKATNLHSVWDGEIIESNGLSYTELAGFASQGRTAADIAAAKRGDLRSWSQESKKLRADLYPPEAVAPNAPVTYLTYCREPVAAEAMPKLGYEYGYRFLPVVYDRLYLAGVRLARLLDETL